MWNSFPIEFVCNPNFNFIQHIQNVKFCQSNAVGQVKCQRKCVHKTINVCGVMVSVLATHAVKPLIM